MKEKLNFFIKKYAKKDNLIAAALFGILLMVIALPFGETKKTEEESEESAPPDITSYEAADSSTGGFETEYRQAMENELTDLLESMDGVGRVKVMITLSTTNERIVLKDYEISEDADSVKTSESTVFYKDEEGEESPYCQKIITPGIEGVVVVAEGGGDPQRIIEITEVVQSLFNVPIHKIRVVRMKSE